MKHGPYNIKQILLLHDLEALQICRPVKRNSVDVHLYRAKVECHVIHHKSHVNWSQLGPRRTGASPETDGLSPTTVPTSHIAVLRFERCRDCCLQFSVRSSFTGVEPVFFPFTNTCVVHQVIVPIKNRRCTPYLRLKVLCVVMIAFALSEADTRGVSCGPSTISKHRLL